MKESLTKRQKRPHPGRARMSASLSPSEGERAGVREPKHQIRLGEIAYARSGDKGSSANVGVIARTPGVFEVLRNYLSTARVEKFFKPLGVRNVIRYELANLGALNFVMPGVLAGGASRSLRTDAQGKTLAQAILEMKLTIPNKT